MGKMGRKLIPMRTAQLTSGEQRGLWPVLVRAKCTMESSCVCACVCVCE